MFRKKKKEYKFLNFFTVKFNFFLIIILISTPRLITNTFTDLRIQTCQPKFDTRKKLFY